MVPSIEETVQKVLALMEGLPLDAKWKVTRRLQELADRGQLEAYAAGLPVDGDG